MKRIFFALTVLLSFIMIACDTIDDLLTFYIDEEETIVVESNFPIGLVALDPVTVPTNSEETFKNNKTRAELVKDVTLNKLTLTIPKSESTDFDFLKNIEIFIKAEGLDEVRVAYLEEVPMNVNTLELKLTNAKLDEYLKKDAYSIRTRAELRSSVTQDIDINAAMRFKVTADPL